MADQKTKNTALPFDATRPLYAVVGVTDLAVGLARNAAAEVSERFERISLTGDAKEARTRLEARVAELQTEALALPVKAQELMEETVAEVTETYDDLAARGRLLVSRIRNQESTQQAKNATRGTASRARSATTQTRTAAKSSTAAVKRSGKRTATSAKETAGTTRAGAKKTSTTTRRSAKSTATAAKKAASATTEAAAEAAAKVGD